MPPNTRPSTPQNNDELVELIVARLQPQLQQINNSVLRLEEQAKTSNALVAKHEQAIAGNGKKGLTATVIDLQDDICEQQKDIDRHQALFYGQAGKDGIITEISHLKRVANTGAWIAGIVIGTVLTTAIASFIYLVQSHPLP